MGQNTLSYEGFRTHNQIRVLQWADERRLGEDQRERFWFSERRVLGMNYEPGTMDKTYIYYNIQILCMYQLLNKPEQREQ